MGSFNETIEKSSRMLHYISLAGLVLVMVILIANILMRAIFSIPIFGSVEMIQYLNLVIVVCALAFTELGNGNIMITMVHEIVKPKVANVLVMINRLVATVMAGGIAYVMILYLKRIYDSNGTTQSLQMPVWIFILFIVIGFILLAFCSFLRFLNAVLTHKDLPNEKPKKLTEEDMEIDYLDM